MMNLSLRKYGYSTKDDHGERMDSIHRAICKNDVYCVYKRLQKLGEFNPVMKEDAENVARIYELNCVEAEEPKTGSMDLSVFLRNYGYFTKKEFNERLDAVERAIEEYGVQAVYERLQTLGQTNPVMKEDAESIARIYKLNVEAVVEAEEEAVVEETSSDEWFLPASAWKALKPETDKGVKLQQSSKDAPKMVTAMGDYGVQDNAHVRMQLLLDLADKHGIFAVLSLMATHLVTLTNPDQQKIMEGDMSALTEAYNTKMKAEGSPDAEKYWAGTAEVEADVKAYVEASAEASAEAEVEAVAEASAEADAEALVEEKKEKKELFLEMLDVKLKKYNHELSILIDDDDTNFLFDKLRESVITAYDEKIKKDKKIMDEAVLEFTKISCVFDNFKTKMVDISKSMDMGKDYFYENIRIMLKEMKNEEIMQNILAKIFEILDEHKNCKLVNISEIEKEQQECMVEARNIFNQIKDLTENKSINRSNDDIEGYVITTNCIVSLYNKVFPIFLSSLIYEERLRNIKISIAMIPCAKDFE